MNGRNNPGHPGIGPDIDLFQIDLQGSIQYAFKVQGVDPDDVNKTSIRFANLDNQTLDEIQPMLRIFDGDGNELGNLENNTEVLVIPSATGTYYAEVSHDAEEDPAEVLNAGVYSLQANVVGEESADLPVDDTTSATITRSGETIKAQIAAGDTDWFRVITSVFNSHTIVVEGNDADGKTALSAANVSVYKEGVTAADSENFAVGTVGDYHIVDLNPQHHDVYFVSISGENGTDTGHCAVRLPEDDYVTLHDYFGYPVDQDSPVSGVIEGDRDRDRIGIEVQDGHNWNIKVAPRGGSLDATELNIIMSDVRKDPYFWGCHTETKDDGTVALTTVDKGFCGTIRYDGEAYTEGESAYFLLDAELDDWANSLARYQVSVTTAQYQEVANTIYQYPNISWELGSKPAQGDGRL